MDNVNIERQSNASKDEIGCLASSRKELRSQEIKKVFKRLERINS